jgi:acyl-CoA synthetase (AMP-forming)/AMP-acid ligase II
MSIGRAMYGTHTIIVDDNNEIQPTGLEGQLCLGGTQLTEGYWKNIEKNSESFFKINYKEKEERFYKTGDLCICDEEGDLLYIGRADFQTKIQGFRVELTEIEFHAKLFLEKINAQAIAYNDEKGNTEIGLVIESEKMDTLGLVEYLKSKLPVYMIPRQIVFIEKFFLNVNGKIDRKKLQELFTA